jgi:non-homologous end joining protein Ku
MNDIKPKNTKTIDIKEFILSREFNPILFERTYHVTPDTKHAAANKAYLLNTLTCQLTFGSPTNF